jgi:DNA gyrase subunit A
MRLVEERGSLVGALVALEDDEVYAIASDGVVIRTRVAEIRATGRDTMGVQLMNVGDATIVAVAKGEAGTDDDDDIEDGGENGPDDGTEAAEDSATSDDTGSPAALDGSASATVTEDSEPDAPQPDRDGA